MGDWVIEADGEVAATGGIALHYNLPYGDIFMEVAEPCRRRGIGRFLVQELKRTCYEIGRIPAVRCHVSNAASGRPCKVPGCCPARSVLSGFIADQSVHHNLGAATFVSTPIGTIEFSGEAADVLNGRVGLRFGPHRERVLVQRQACRG